jgi:hypothetical protein
MLARDKFQLDVWIWRFQQLPSLRFFVAPRPQDFRDGTNTVDFTDLSSSFALGAFYRQRFVIQENRFTGRHFDFYNAIDLAGVT